MAGLVRSVRDRDKLYLCDDSLGLVDIPGSISASVRLPSARQLCESAVDNRVLSPVVREVHQVGTGHLDLVIHEATQAGDGARHDGGVRAHIGGGVKGNLDLQSVRSQVARENAVSSNVLALPAQERTVRDQDRAHDVPGVQGQRILASQIDSREILQLLFGILLEVVSHKLEVVTAVNLLSLGEKADRLDREQTRVLLVGRARQGRKLYAKVHIADHAEGLRQVDGEVAAPPIQCGVA